MWPKFLGHSGSECWNQTITEKWCLEFSCKKRPETYTNKKYKLAENTDELQDPKFGKCIFPIRAKNIMFPKNWAQYLFPKNFPKINFPKGVLKEL